MLGEHHAVKVNHGDLGYVQALVLLPLHIPHTSTHTSHHTHTSPLHVFFEDLLFRQNDHPYSFHAPFDTPFDTLHDTPHYMNV